MQKAPPVEWRRLSGYGPDINQPPPQHLEPESRSEGDLNRNSFRRGAYHRLSTRAVANDDGTPITERVEALLVEILAELRQLNGINKVALDVLTQGEDTAGR